ncbi:MAG TPA: hypothetical protein VF596_05135 [Pyrinomonadaceae bacterium]|jgi:hypothetical protein
MKHIDIGTIHAFLDGELSGERLEFAASHFSICDACSNLMLEAESENDAVMQAFSIENAYVVPTQRIWARINNEIDQLDSIPATAMQPSIWQTAFGLLGLSRLPQFAAPTAGLALGAALIAFFLFSGIFRQANPEINPPIIAQNENPPSTVVNVKPTGSNPSVEQPKTAPLVAIKNETQKRPGGFESVKANYRVEAKPKVITPKTIKNPPVRNDYLNAPLVEERLYLEAINDLSQTVASGDVAAMRPSFRVEYEQNAAMIDQAIVKMQRQVRRNPNDENAKRILFASYQNKIDLLNTVAEKTQLMATVR